MTISLETLPCCHRGPEIADGRYACAHPAFFGSVGASLAMCEVCTGRNQRCGEDRQAPFSWVAPLGTAGIERSWQGRCRRKPWEYRITVAIPHLNTLESLRLVVDLLRLQTEPVYLLVIDTGSPPEVLTQLEAMRAEDLEVHAIRAHGYIHSSAPVAAAMDLAFALCRSQILIGTHADVYLRRRDAVAWLAGQCPGECPVVGWEMSPRAGTNLWRGTPSHTFSAYWMPRMRSIGASWSFERWYERNGVPADPTVGWPDTESTLRDCLDQAGIVPKLLGTEPNFQLHRTEFFDHARSQTCVKTYGADAGLTRRVNGYGTTALLEARQRVAAWRAEVKAEQARRLEAMQTDSIPCHGCPKV